MSTSTSVADPLPKKSLGRLSWRQRIIIGCLISPIVILLVAILAGFIGYRVFLWRAQRNMQAEIAAVRESGAPLTTIELNESYQPENDVPDLSDDFTRALKSLDDAELVKQVDGLAKRNAFEGFPKGHEPWPHLADSQKALSFQAPILDACETIAGQEFTVRYACDLRPGIQADVSHLKQVRGAARVLALATRVDFLMGDTSRSISRLRQQLALQETLRSEPVLVSQLTRVALIGMVRNDLEQIMAQEAIDSADLQKLQISLRGVDMLDGFHRAFEGERACCYTQMTLPAKLIDNEAIHHDPEALNDYARTLPTRSADTAQMLNMFRRILEAGDSSFPEAYAEAVKVDDELKMLAKSSTRLLYIQTLLYLPALSKAVAVYARAEANCDAADAAIAALLYRRTVGKWPDHLERLVPDYLPAVPDDPYKTGKLLMRSTSDSLKVYSVGENGVDDGGVLKSPEWLDVGIAVTWREEK